MLSPLANPVYRRLFAAQVIALAGTGSTTIALALLAYDLAGGQAGVVLGTALVIKMVSYVFVAPIASAFAPRLPRRKLLIGLDIARAAIVLTLPFVTDLWQIYALIFLLNACSAIFTPTFQATIPDILPDDAQYTRALSMSRLAYDLENLLSPLLAAAALTVFTYNALFVTNAVTFLVSACLIWRVQLPSLRPGEVTANAWHNITLGVRSYLRTPRLRGLLALSMAAAAAGAMVIVNTVVYVRDHLNGSETDTAIAFAAFGAGSMLTALVLPRALDRLPDRPIMLAGSVLLSAGLLLGVLEPGPGAILMLWMALGVGASAVQTPAGGLLKRSASHGNRPAIYAAQFALSHGCWLVAYAIAGWIGGTYGLSVAFLVLGIVASLSTAAAWILTPASDPQELFHTHEFLHHSHSHTHDVFHQHEHTGGEGAEPHNHSHDHSAVSHRHTFFIDLHHSRWPSG